MRILALITARGGSKRLPGKNIRLLGGKPLIVWSIDVAKDIPEICDILVSTDEQAIAAVSKDFGALVPWLRPAEFATDSASSVDVALHALDWYEAHKGKVDGLLLLQPTSPFRTRKSVCEGIRLFVKNDRKAVLGVSPTHAHPMWTLKMEGNFLLPYMQEHGFDMRSQDLPLTYVVNGSFYIISPDELRECRSFMPACMLPLISLDQKESLDIDTQSDWNMAEFFLSLAKE